MTGAFAFVAKIAFWVSNKRSSLADCSAVVRGAFATRLNETV